jgi:hypothetical protein
VFATLNPTGSTAPNLDRATIVAWRGIDLPLPAVDSVSRYWDLAISRSGGATSDTISGPTADETRVTEADAATATITRVRGSDGRVDTQVLNVPSPGMRIRPGTSSLAPIVIAPLPGLGMALVHSPGPFQSMPYINGISVNRP